MSRLTVLVLTVLALIVAVPAGAETQPAPPLDLSEVLFRASRYVVAYQHALDGVAADETYEQLRRNADGEVTDSKTLASTYAFVLVATDGVWRAFRQVRTVDGEPVRRRGRDLLEVLRDSDMDADDVRDELERFERDAGDHYLGNADRRLQLPLLPLMFLDPLYRHRFDFDRLGVEETAGGETWQVRFVERQRPTMIQSVSGNSYAQGSFWIDTETGRILRTELTLPESGASITVVFDQDPALDVWVPTRVEETYQLPEETIEGVLAYTNFQRFPVGVTLEIP